MKNKVKDIDIKNCSSIQIEGISTFCLGYFMVGVLAHFRPKKSDKRNWQNSQRFWTISSF